MTWPNTTISTDNVDAGTDEPRLAREQIKQTIDAVNSMITDGPTRGFVEINFNNGLTYAGNTRRRANATVNYSTGQTIVNKITDDGEVEFAPGVYLVDLPQTTPQSAGAWNWSANTGAFGFTGETIAVTQTGGGSTLFFPQMSSSTTVFYANVVTSANLNFALSVNNPPLENIRFTRLA